MFNFSFNSGDNSLAEFEELENQIAEEVENDPEIESRSLPRVNYDEILAEIDDGAQQIDEIRKKRLNHFERDSSDNGSSYNRELSGLSTSGSFMQDENQNYDSKGNILLNLLIVSMFITVLNI